MRYLSLLFLLYSACYNPSPGAHRFICNTEPGQPQCPEGFPCIQGCCGGPPCGLDIGSPPDGSTPSDIGTMAPGCASGRGFPLGANLYACPGTFTAGALRQLCAPGFGLPFTNVNPAGLTALTAGFFVANAYGSEPGMPPPTAALACQWTGQPKGQQRYLFGGGAGSSVSSSPQKCSQFALATFCDPMDGTTVGATDWKCPLSAQPKNQDFDNVVNGNPQNGVLCWKP